MTKIDAIKNIFLKIKRQHTLPLAHRLILNKTNDCYIIGYPRSGNTWLRTILTNILVPGANSDPYIIESTLPGVSLRKIYTINRLPSPRIIHSHSCFQPDIIKAVYLLRDGRDVVVSYYHYMVTKRGRAKEESFSQFFDLYCQGVYGQQWHQNIESWLLIGKNQLDDRMLVVHFEDLKKNPKGVIKDVTRFLNIQTSSLEINNAISNSEIDRLRALEKSMLGFDGENPDMSFYRGGKSGQWKGIITSEIEEKFYEISSRALKLGGYI